VQAEREGAGDERQRHLRHVGGRATLWSGRQQRVAAGDRADGEMMQAVSNTSSAPISDKKVETIALCMPWPGSKVVREGKSGLGGDQVAAVSSALMIRRAMVPTSTPGRRFARDQRGQLQRGRRLRWVIARGDRRSARETASAKARRTRGGTPASPMTGSSMIMAPARAKVRRKTAPRPAIAAG
jgi:hypothetical protein